MDEDDGQAGEREERAGEEVDGQDEEVHDELKALHVLQAGADGHAERGEQEGDEHHESHGDGDGEKLAGRKPASRQMTRPAGPG